MASKKYLSDAWGGHEKQTTTEGAHAGRFWAAWTTTEISQAVGVLGDAKTTKGVQAAGTSRRDNCGWCADRGVLSGAAIRESAQARRR